MSVIHPLRMPYFSQNNKFIVDNLAKNTCNKTRNHVIVGEKASEIFKLVLSVQAGLKHKVRLTKDHMLQQEEGIPKYISAAEKAKDPCRSLRSSLYTSS